MTPQCTGRGPCHRSNQTETQIPEILDFGDEVVTEETLGNHLWVAIFDSSNPPESFAGAAFINFFHNIVFLLTTHNKVPLNACGS
jgi:hypothetical protein